MMRNSYTFALTLLLAGLAFFTFTSQSDAASVSSNASLFNVESHLIASSQVEKVSWNNECPRRVKHMCAERWGHGTSRYRQCLRKNCDSISDHRGRDHRGRDRDRDDMRHGRNRCDRWKSICRDKFGHGFDFRRCMRKEGCAKWTNF